MTSLSTWRARLGAPSALALCTLIGSAPACSEERPPSLVAEQPSESGHSGTSAAAGGSSESGGANGQDGAEAGSSAESGGAAGAAGNPENVGGQAPSAPPACDPSISWSSAANVAVVSSAASESLLALTPDELDLAFLRDGRVFVAHRATADATFSVGSPLVIPSGWTASHGAALSADGERLILVSDPDQKMLGELSRTSRSAPFTGEVDTSAFAAVNQDSIFTGRIYASPTISAGDDQLFFNSAFGDDDSTVVVSTRSGAAWSTPRSLGAGVFDGGSGQRRLPTGVAADGRTLFYFNEESAEEEARWRASDSIDSPLYDMQSLGKRRGAAPNSSCNRLYSEANADVVVEND